MTNIITNTVFSIITNQPIYVVDSCSGSGLTFGTIITLIFGICTLSFGLSFFNLKYEKKQLESKINDIKKNTDEVEKLHALTKIFKRFINTHVYVSKIYNIFFGVLMPEKMPNKKMWIKNVLDDSEQRIEKARSELDLYFLDLDTMVNSINNLVLKYGDIDTALIMQELKKYCKDEEKIKKLEDGIKKIKKRLNESMKK